MPLRILSAAGLVLGGSYLLVSADAWDALAGGLGLLAWALAVVAAGVVLAGAQRRGVVPTGAALPVLSLAACMPFSRAEEPFTWGFLAVPVLGVGGAALTAAAAWAARGLRYRVPQARRSGPAVEVVAVGAALLALAWGVWLDQRVVDRHPAHPAVIDDVRGTFRAVAPGDPTTSVARRLGRPTVTPSSRRGFGAPVDQTLGDFDGPTSFAADRSWRYRGVAVLVDDDRAERLVITDASAETPAGVGIGDSLEVARRAYDHLACGGELLGSDAVNPAYPSCVGHLAGRAGITFYGDPIESITLQRGASGPRLTRR